MAKKPVKKSVKDHVIKNYRIPVIVTSSGRFMAVSPAMPQGVLVTVEDDTWEGLGEKLTEHMADLPAKPDPAKIRILDNGLFRLMGDGSILLDSPMLRAKFSLTEVSRGKYQDSLEAFLSKIQNNYRIEDFPSSMMDIYENEADNIHFDDVDPYDLYPALELRLEKIRFLDEKGQVVLDVEKPMYTSGKSKRPIGEVIDFDEEYLHHIMMDNLNTFIESEIGQYRYSMEKGYKRKPYIPQVPGCEMYGDFHDALYSAITNGEVNTDTLITLCHSPLNKSGYPLHKCIRGLYDKFHESYPDADFPDDCDYLVPVGTEEQIEEFKQLLQGALDRLNEIPL